MKVTSIENGSGEIDWLAKTGYGSRLKSDDISVDPAQDRECSKGPPYGPGNVPK